MSEQKGAKAPKSQPDFWSYENLRSLGVLVVIILAIRWSVASPYHVPTPSMEPTIKVGDRLLANKLSYELKLPFTDYVLLKWDDIKRGDIVVFKYPEDTSLDFVKRVVALPGDRVKIIDDVLYINGQAQQRSDFNHQRSLLTDINAPKETKLLYKENLHGLKHWTMNTIEDLRYPHSANWPESGQEYVVPEDGLFAIGDNRDDSKDSRSWGPVPRSYVKGKAMFVLWSMFSKDKEWLPTFRFERFFTALN